jgi:hypothetical protein
VISSRTTRSQAIRQLATLFLFVFCCMILPVGCGEPATQQSNIPTDFAKKLEKERPEIFIEKTGKKKTEVLGGRDKRAVIRREMEKEREQGTQ